jgi:hypothetical protein
MAVHLPKRDAIGEANDALDRHLEILKKVRAIHIDANLAKEGFLYLSASPMIYSAWEGFFRLSCSICLRRKCQRGKLAKKYDELYSTLWLQKEPFLDQFMARLFNSITPGKDASKPTSGKFSAIATLSAGISTWLHKPLTHTVNFDKLVMTYSNVKPDVVKLNAAVIGLDITTVDLTGLDDLLRSRNNVAHGGLITNPTESEVTALLDYTESLLRQFHAAVLGWIRAN